MLWDITLDEFKNLDKLEQAEALYKFGAEIAERNSGKNKFVLYQLGSFYADVKFNPATDIILEIVPFNSEEMPEPYLAQIDVSEIIKN